MHFIEERFNVYAKRNCRAVRHVKQIAKGIDRTNHVTRTGSDGELSRLLVDEADTQLRRERSGVQRIGRAQCKRLMKITH